MLLQVAMQGIYLCIAGEREYAAAHLLLGTLHPMSDI